MGCLLEIIFTVRIDDEEKRRKFYKHHRHLFGHCEFVSNEKRECDRICDRIYIVPGVEKASAYIHETLERDDRVLSARIIS